MNRKDAYAKIYASPELQKEFSQNPEAVLKKLEVDMTGLKIKKNVPKPDKGLPDPNLVSCSSCVSVGCVVCFDVGSS